MQKHSDVKEEKDMIEVDFGPILNVLNEEYLEICEGIQSEIMSTTRFDESSDLSTTYLGKSDRSKMKNVKQKSLFPHQSKDTH